MTLSPIFLAGAPLFDDASKYHISIRGTAKNYDAAIKNQAELLHAPKLTVTIGDGIDI